MTKEGEGMIMDCKTHELLHLWSKIQEEEKIQIKN